MESQSLCVDRLRRNARLIGSLESDDRFEVYENEQGFIKQVYVVSKDWQQQNDQSFSPLAHFQSLGESGLKEAIWQPELFDVSTSLPALKQEVASLSDSLVNYA